MKCALITALIALFCGSYFCLADDASRSAQEDDIREAVLRCLLKNFDPDGLPGAAPENRPKAYFVGVGPKDEDPTDAFLKRFVDAKHPLRKLSACNQSVRGDFDKTTNERGYVLTVDDTHWFTDSDVEVSGGWHINGLCAEWGLYRVKKAGGKWTVVKYKPVGAA